MVGSGDSRMAVRRRLPGERQDSFFREDEVSVKTGQLQARDGSMQDGCEFGANGEPTGCSSMPVMRQRVGT
jgi:hypothetical protein